MAEKSIKIPRPPVEDRSSSLFYFFIHPSRRLSIERVGSARLLWSEHYSSSILSPSGTHEGFRRIIPRFGPSLAGRPFPSIGGRTLPTRISINFLQYKPAPTSSTPSVFVRFHVAVLVYELTNSMHRAGGGTWAFRYGVNDSSSHQSLSFTMPFLRFSYFKSKQQVTGSL